MIVVEPAERAIEGIGGIRFKEPVRVLLEYRYKGQPNPAIERVPIEVIASLLDHAGTPYVFASGRSEEKALEGLEERIKGYLIELRKPKHERPKYGADFAKRLEGLRKLVPISKPSD